MSDFHLNRPLDKVKKTNGRKLWRSAVWRTARANTEARCSADKLLRIKGNSKEDFQDENQGEQHNRNGRRSVGRQERQDDCGESKGQQ